MSNSNEPAFPRATQNMWTGLTKREYFAAMAMQGLLSGLGFVEKDGQVGLISHEELAKPSVDYADALLAELEKEK